MPESIQATLDARLSEIGVDAATVAAHPMSTLVPDLEARESAAREAIDALIGLGRPDLDRNVELGATLGQGGMGLVRVGAQRSLGREVAVKSLKPGVGSERATLDLLREAWVTGALEHPNVVPVHDLGMIAGAPGIVMKRIEGVAWSEVMHDPEQLAARFGAHDPLEWNLEVLGQVARAIHFAHSRGILHRDIKPDNVMVGSFGEVYVVDWGIAVGLGDAPSERLPLARDATRMAGTPAYMAPEMLGGAPSRLGAWTDVYLLGATLFEICEGHPPHAGARLLELVQSILEPVELTSASPEGLADLIRSATRIAPEERIADAEMFRRELLAFHERQGSVRLAAGARERLEELEELLATEGAAASRARAFHLFGECRFGFRKALEVWADNESAARDLERAVSAMIRLELSAGEPRAAEILLAELAAPPAELRAEVDRAVAAQKRDREAAEQLSRELSMQLGARTRLAVIVPLGVLFVGGPLLNYVGSATGVFEPSFAPGLIVMGVLFVVSLLAGWAVRKTVMATRINRALAAAIVCSLGLALLNHGYEWLADLPINSSVPGVLAANAAVVAMVAVTTDTRVTLAAVGYLGASFLAAAWPSSGLLPVALANAVLLFVFVRAWSGDARRDATSERSER